MQIAVQAGGSLDLPSDDKFYVLWRSWCGVRDSGEAFYYVTQVTAYRDMPGVVREPGDRFAPVRIWESFWTDECEARAHVAERLERCANEILRLAQKCRDGCEEKE